MESAEVCFRARFLFHTRSVCVCICRLSRARPCDSVRMISHMSVLRVRERVTVADESRLSAQVYFYLRPTADYSSNV